MAGLRRDDAGVGIRAFRRRCGLSTVALAKVEATIRPAKWRMPPRRHARKSATIVAREASSKENGE
jgi:hypothetical protein